MSFNIKFDDGDLKRLSENLTSQNILSPLIPDINTAIDKFHNSLENRIASVYKAPALLSSVRQPTQLTSGALSMDYKLTYANVPIPLSKYKVDILNPIVVRNAIPFLRPNGNISYTPVNKATPIRVTIKNRNSGAALATRKKTPFKKFFAKGEVFVRTEQATWKEFPSMSSKGIRTPIKILFGPSLANLVSTVYSNDTTFINGVKDTLSNDILTAFTKNIKDL